MRGYNSFSALDKDILELQKRGVIEDNSKIIFLTSQQKHMLLVGWLYCCFTSTVNI